VSQQPQDDAAIQPEDGTAKTTEPELHRVAVRRAPKWSVFLVIGLLVGLIATIAVTTAFPADPNVGMGMTVFIVGIFVVPLGVALGALAALIADRASFRRVREVTVERGEVHVVPEPARAPEPAPTATESAPGPERAHGDAAPADSRPD